MSKNVGAVDKWARIVIGVLLLFLFGLDSGWRWLGLLAIVPFATAFMGVCPVWSMIGINTRKET